STKWAAQSRGSMQSVDELRENLNTYREQLEQVRAADQLKQRCAYGEERAVLIVG
ncbi:unnamed protein product, partial [Closterium sp. NIES-54]